MDAGIQKNYFGNSIHLQNVSMHIFFCTMYCNYCTGSIESVQGECGMFDWKFDWRKYVNRVLDALCGDGGPEGDGVRMSPPIVTPDGNIRRFPMSADGGDYQSLNRLDRHSKLKAGDTYLPTSMGAMKLSEPRTAREAELNQKSFGHATPKILQQPPIVVPAWAKDAGISPEEYMAQIGSLSGGGMAETAAMLARKAERERCAQVADKAALEYKDLDRDVDAHAKASFEGLCQHIAEKIRSGGIRLYSIAGQTVFPMSTGEFVSYELDLDGSKAVPFRVFQDGRCHPEPLSIGVPPLQRDGDSL